MTPNNEDELPKAAESFQVRGMNCSQTGMSSGEEGRENVCRDYDNVRILHPVGLCRQLPAEILVRRLGAELTCGL